MPKKLYTWNGSAWDEVSTGFITSSPKISELVLTSGTTTVYRDYAPGSPAANTSYISPSVSTIEVLLVGGGGSGGGGTNGGGGGAGGVITQLFDVRDISSFVVTIGSGGTGTTGAGNNGTDSTIVMQGYGTVTAGGGGAGAAATAGFNAPGNPGASCGGAAGTATVSGCGGGGAGGIVPFGTVAANGKGIGFTGGMHLSSSVLQADNAAESFCMAPGGDGLTIFGRMVAGGGNGGLGTAVANLGVGFDYPIAKFGAAAGGTSSKSATANTGAGGGGGDSFSTTAGSGGSGICVIRYLEI